MAAQGRASCTVLVLVLILAWGNAPAAGGAVISSKQPALFLTVKSSNFGITKTDHIKYGFLIVTDILISPDGVPLPFFNDKCVYKKRSGLKIIASFGGSVVPSDLFTFLSCDDNRRAVFVNNLVDFTQSHGFHGIDLSWLYPAPQERDRYVRLLKDLRVACDRNGLVLTVTVPSRPSVIEVNYPVETLEKYADYVILSTTEFRKLRKTSFIAPLQSSSPGSSNSINYHVDRWKMAGLSCGKLVIVIQTMTLTYKLYIQNEYRIGTPALQLKIRPYYKICRKLYSGSLEIWDSSAKSPYAFRDLSWYSYENEKSIKEKVCFVVQQGLGGIAVFYYDEDDPINICGDGQYPMTAIVMAALQSEYLPPSVITDSQIYHFVSPSMSSSMSRLNQDTYNTALRNMEPFVFYVDEKDKGSNAYKTNTENFVDKFLSSQVSSNAMGEVPPLPGSAPTTENSVLPNSVNLLEQDLFSDTSVSDEHFDDLDELNAFFSDISQVVEVGDSVDIPAPSSNNGGTPLLVLADSGPDSTTSLQLFSENAPIGGSDSCSLFSEQPNTQRVVYTEPCPQAAPCTHSPNLPPLENRPKQCPHTLPGIRIFATAHAATPTAPTTTTTTTTTQRPLQLITMIPATYRPPTFCQACKPCIKFIASSSSDRSKLSSKASCPPSIPAPCAMAQLYSEQGRSLPLLAVQLPTNAFKPPGSASQFQANAMTPFVAFGAKICPCDGILQDPHDRRSYYLCKRGLPMCDENKFTCANGYIFDETSKKCVVERA